MHLLRSSLYRRGRRRRRRQHYHLMREKPTLLVSLVALDSVSLVCLPAPAAYSAFRSNIDCIDLNMCVGLFIFDVESEGESEKEKGRNLLFIVIPRFLGYEYDCNANRLIEMKRRITATTTTGTSDVRRRQRCISKIHNFFSVVPILRFGRQRLLHSNFKKIIEEPFSFLYVCMGFQKLQQQQQQQQMKSGEEWRAVKRPTKNWSWLGKCCANV